MQVNKVDMKWRVQFCEILYRFLLGVIIATVFAEAIISIL